MTTRRLSRIFAADGRTVIIALDHGLIDGPCEGFENPASTISAVVTGGADAILTSFGIAERLAAELGSVGLIVRSDGAEPNLGTPTPGSLSKFFGPMDALRIGADALVVTAAVREGLEQDEEVAGWLAEKRNRELVIQLRQKGRLRGSCDQTDRP